MTREPQSYVDIKQIRTTLEDAPSRRAIVLIECGAAPVVWQAAPVAPSSLGDAAAENFDIDRTLAGKTRRGPIIVLRDPSGRFEPGCATRHDPRDFDAHAGCQHGMVTAVLAMTDRGHRLRDNRRSRSELSAALKDNSPPWP